MWACPERLGDGSGRGVGTCLYRSLQRVYDEQMTKRPINVRLDDDLIDAIDALAAATRTDRTELMARGLRRELLHDGRREFIYVLLDESGEVRYVGRSRDPFGRLRPHLADAKVGGTDKQTWLADMIAAGHVPQLAIVDDAEPGQDVAALETDWIERFADGGRLTNGVRAGVASTPRRTGHLKQVGQFDERLLELIDEQAAILGQSRRTYMERLLWKHLDELGAPATREDPETPARKTKRR
jgi:hypothetical protein